MGKVVKITYPGKCGSQYIRVYESFNEELKEIIYRSGYEREFIIKYNKALRFLENLKRNCIQSDLFEILINENGLYAMRLRGSKNIRILFVFEVVDGHEIAILLNCFEEKAKKDYDFGKKIADDRIHNLSKE